MAILSTGNTFSTGNQVTASSLNDAVNAATFDTPADGIGIEVGSSGLLALKDGGTTPEKLSTGGPDWDSSGNTTITGQVDISGASAGQVKFPATQNASSDANTLDDYEEGTWTPSVGGTATYTSQSGTYTKIGRMVFITCSITINSIGTGSAYIISGLPFTAAAEGAITVSNWSDSASSYVYLVGGVDSGASTLSIRGATAATGTIDASANFFQDSTGIKMSGCYYV
jgi:hypothetical protein